MRVFVNGTFDLLHPGHIALLTFAKSQGTHLLVALDSDSRVRQLKGPTRPINCQHTRQTIMMNLKPVDAVCIFDSDQQLIDIIKQYSPDIMIVGSDYKDKKVIGSEYARSLVFFQRDLRYSSTQIIETVNSRR